MSSAVAEFRARFPAHAAHFDRMRQEAGGRCGAAGDAEASGLEPEFPSRPDGNHGDNNLGTLAA